jgi:hypothetical protein
MIAGMNSLNNSVPTGLSHTLMNVKNVMGGSMIAIGLILSIIGWNRKAPETVTQTVKGAEVVLNNSESQNFNWRAFMGLTFAIIGTGILILPGDKQLEAERYGR